MILFIGKIIYFYIIAFFLAILEIQIEGPHGWAEKLPYWRPSLNKLFNRLLVKTYNKISGKKFTGYHFFLNIFLLLFLHLPFIWGVKWSLLAEFEILAFFMIFMVFWDFLWFVLNPNFSLRDFKKENVWWHKNWLGPLPVDYYIGILLSFLLFSPLILQNPDVGLIKFAILFLGNLVLTAITVFLYPKAY